MLVAKFGPTTGWLGKAITHENGQFVLGGHGPISAQAVMEYDRQGQLLWVADGTRAWVGSIAARTPQPAPASAANGAASPGIDDSQRVRSLAVQQATLQACPACEHQVSSQARACPSCGHPIAPSGLAVSAASVGAVVSRVPSSGAAMGGAIRRASARVVVNRRTVGASLVLLGGLMVAVGSVLPWTEAYIGLETITRNGFALGENHGFSIAGLLVLLDGLLLGYIGLSRLFRFDMVPYVSGSAIWVGAAALVYFIWIYSAIPDFIASLKKDGISASEGPGGSVIVLGCLLAIGAGFLLRSAQKRRL